MTAQLSGGSRADLSLIGIESVSHSLVIFSIAIGNDKSHRIFKAE